MKTLFTWLGITDLRASKGELPQGVGPIANALEAMEFDKVVILTDHSAENEELFEEWLREKTDAEIHLTPTKLASPTHFGDIYKAAIYALKKHAASATEMTFHLSPGTPAMASVWIILAKTQYEATLIESSLKEGVKVASVPFDITAEFIPDLLKSSDEKLKAQSLGAPPANPAFDAIIHRCDLMKRLVSKAQKVSYRSVPVLIHGESGTGKELLARAIHGASPRSNKPFVAVNCGAIPKDLIDSELFGHIKGAFSGSHQDRKGHFEEANGGTLFLDEIGELPPEAQVRLLRVLQEGEVTRVGTSKAIPIDVRILSATNRNLMVEVQENRFREDLFHRLAVGVLTIPPLREREGDLNLLIDAVFDLVQKEAQEQPGYQHKNISSGARNLMLRHSWPGNIRELQNTLRRASIWTDGDEITAEDLQESMLPLPESAQLGNRVKPITDGFSLPDAIKDLATEYIEQAMEQAGGNKTQAAGLLGLGSYQTLSNWMTKYGLS